MGHKFIGLCALGRWALMTVCALFGAQTALADSVMITPTSGQRGVGAKLPGAVRAANASANIKAAIQFLRDWGMAAEADNIQKWFEDKRIWLDWDITGGNTPNATRNISLGGMVLLGAESKNSNLAHKFDPADPKDKELIAELAFTLVHEKVHAHQDYFGYGGEKAESEAYNKEIDDNDRVIIKMVEAAEKAADQGDRARVRELLEWIHALVEVKLDAIRSLRNNFPESGRRIPDKLIRDLEDIRKACEGQLKKFSLGTWEPGPAVEELRRLREELQTLETTIALHPMPAYWQRVRENPEVAAKEERKFGLSLSVGGASMGRIESDTKTGVQLKLSYDLDQNFYVAGSYLRGTSFYQTTRPQAPPQQGIPQQQQGIPQQPGPASSVLERTDLHVLAFGAGFRYPLSPGLSSYVEPRLGTILGGQVDGNITGLLSAGVSIPVAPAVALTVDATGLLSNAKIGPDNLSLDQGWFLGGGVTMSF